jgi:hypothetical protein
MFIQNFFLLLIKNKKSKKKKKKKKERKGKCMIRKNRREFICGKLLLLSYSAYDDENL